MLRKSQREAEAEELPKPQKRKKHRSPAAKNSLRRVAVEAQRSRDGNDTKKSPSEEPQSSTKQKSSKMQAITLIPTKPAFILRSFTSKS
ncbi:MAG: hypothetical protein L6R41_007387 [Letrouitia leprolyta]|nr:MAG: hypothetical protein L6R41_007387 [Letrouitia leprolyta]